jgi:hypothetical protein
MGVAPLILFLVSASDRPVPILSGDRVEFEFEFSDGKRKAPRVVLLDPRDSGPLRARERGAPFFLLDS